MTMPRNAALRERVGAVVAVVLGTAEVGAAGAASEWDSLQQIEVVLAVEDEFGVTIAESDIPGLRSIDDVTALLAGVHASR